MPNGALSTKVTAAVHGELTLASGAAYGPNIGDFVVQSLPRVEAPTVEVFQRLHVRPRQPVVLHRFAADWPAVRRWSLDYLRSAFAATPVTTAHVEAGTVAVNDDTGLSYESVRLGEFIDGLRSGQGDRYMMSRLEDLPAELRRHAPPPSYCAGAPWLSAKLWISAPGTVSYMHRDLADNLHAMVAGRKRFTLVSPSQSSLLYPKTLFDSIPNGCHVDIEKPDFVRFPKLRGLGTFVVELEPGDVIYIPRRWWHHVRTLEVGVSVNYWWASGVRSTLVLAGDYFKRVRGIAR